MWCSSTLLVAVNSKQRSKSLKKVTHTIGTLSRKKVVEIGHFGIADGINDRPYEYKSSCMSQKRGSMALVTRSSSFNTYTEKDLAILALLCIYRKYTMLKDSKKGNYKEKYHT